MNVFRQIPLTGNYLNSQLMPGFGPAAEVLFFREKDPKPLTPSPASADGTDAGYGRRTNSLRSNKARQ